MYQILQYLIPVVVEYRYWAIYGALTVAGFGVPIPEEATIIVSSYLSAIDVMPFWPVFLVCYAGVLSGDLVTYTIGRYGGRYFLESRYARFLITQKRLAQVQYYYRLYGEVSILGARQVPGLRFASFFTAGLMRMKFYKFILLDAVAAMVSMPVVFFITYFFGPRLRDAVNLIVRIGDYTFAVALGVIVTLVIGVTVYRYYWDTEETDDPNFTTEEKSDGEIVP